MFPKPNLVLYQYLRVLIYLNPFLFLALYLRGYKLINRDLHNFFVFAKTNGILMNLAQVM